MLSHHGHDKVILGIRPEDIEDIAFVKETNPASTFDARISMVEPMGANVYLRLISGSHHLMACVNSKTRAKAGETLELACDLSNARIYDIETGNLLA